jgi:hypothetical protein
MSSGNQGKPGILPQAARHRDRAAASLGVFHPEYAMPSSK